jgi:ABC-2 type transport system ATP-binding protein
MAAIIKVDRLSKEYKLYQREAGLWGSLRTLFSREYRLVTAVDDISFDIEAGAKVAYIGPNGAGKSTTIKILTGIMAPTRGHCEVAGVVPYRERVRNARNIGVVFGQRTQLWWDLPVADSFAILRRIYEIPDAVFAKNMQLFRQLLAIDEVMGVPVRKLSLGQRMRIEIAASFLHDPRVVFLDEPTIGLDAVLKEAIRGLINCMNREVGTTIVLTSHDMDDIKEICDDVVLIDKSRLVYQGSLARLQQMAPARSVLFDYRSTPGSQAALAALQQQFRGIDAVEHEGGSRVRIHFQRERLALPALMAHLFAHLDVLDVTSHEPDLDSIVRHIYRHGIAQGAAA